MVDFQGPTSSVPQSATQRPVPLRMRPDLDIKRILYGESGWIVVKDPCRLQYFRLQPEQFAVLESLNGRRGLGEIRDLVQAQFRTVHVSVRDVQVLIVDLHDKGLVTTERLGQAGALVREQRNAFWKRFWQTVRNPLYMRVPGWDPDRLLTRLLPWVRWMFSPWSLTVACLVIVASWVFLAMRFADVQRRLPEFHQFFAWPNLCYLWLTMAAAKVLHEFGHGLVCKRFGRECHSMGVMLLVFSPTLYCDVTDSWMLKSKWERIAIGGAGIAVEVFLAAIAIFLWWHTQPGLMNHLCLNVFFVSTVTTVIFNANPLLRFDGYYMLADWLEMPNLRQKATQMLQQSFAWTCLGIRTPEDAFMPQAGRNWLVAYAVASAVYRWVVLFGITLFLYTVLKPYRLQSIGTTLAVVSLASVVLHLIWSVVQIIRRPRNEPMSRTRVAISLTVVFAVLAGALFLNVPWYIEAPFYLEPQDVRPVYATVSGTLTSSTEAGTAVDAGDVVANLENEALDDRLRELQMLERRQRAKSQTQLALGDADARRLAEQELQSICEQRADVESQLARLEVVAPVGGTLVAPPELPERRRDRRGQLRSWTGSPLESRNIGCFLEAQTHLVSIAPTDQYQAVLLVDQADRDDLAVGRTVRLKVDHLPGVVFTGRLIEYSLRDEEMAPAVLSNKYGGPLPTISDPQGERLTSAAYRAVVVFESDAELLRTGMHGNARVLIANRSAGSWIWRWLRTTFKFRL